MRPQAILIEMNIANVDAEQDIKCNQDRFDKGIFLQPLLTPLYDQEVKHIDNFNIEFTYQPIF
jgi:hypothetical protein